MRIGQELLDQVIPPIALGVDQPVEEAVVLRVLNPIVQITLFLVTKCLAIADEEFEITRVGLVHGREVNLVDDPMTQGKPDSAPF